MKKIPLILFLLLIVGGTGVLALEPAAVTSLSLKEKELSDTCNLEARNSLVSGDLSAVERVCGEAIRQIETSSDNREAIINPIMNLAVSYMLAGQFDRAMPLYNRAKKIRETLYGADSGEVKEINDMIRRLENMKRRHLQ